MMMCINQQLVVVAVWRNSATTRIHHRQYLRADSRLQLSRSLSSSCFTNISMYSTKYTNSPSSIFGQPQRGGRRGAEGEQLETDATGCKIQPKTGRPIDHTHAITRLASRGNKNKQKTKKKEKKKKPAAAAATHCAHDLRNAHRLLGIPLLYFPLSPFYPTLAHPTSCLPHVVAIRANRLFRQLRRKKK